jgi:hypothetical protein
MKLSAEQAARTDEAVAYPLQRFYELQALLNFKPEELNEGVLETKFLECLREFYETEENEETAEAVKFMHQTLHFALDDNTLAALCLKFLYDKALGV